MEVISMSSWKFKVLLVKNISTALKLAKLPFICWSPPWTQYDVPTFTNYFKVLQAKRELVLLFSHLISKQFHAPPIDKIQQQEITLWLITLIRTGLFRFSCCWTSRCTGCSHFRLFWCVLVWISISGRWNN